MKRRGFLATLMGALAAPFVRADVAVPLTSKDGEVALAGLRARHARALLDNAYLACNPPYIAFIHPSWLRDIKDLDARGRWRTAWRRYRLARREAVCGYLPSPLVMERFADAPPPAMNGEIGSVEGIRLIQAGEIYNALGGTFAKPLEPSSLTLDLIRRATRELKA